MSGDLRMIFHGAVLVVLGLLSGFATAVVPAPNMALAAHTIGIIEGTLCIAVAFVWPILQAHGYQLTKTRYALLIGFYCNWLGAILAGVWSAKMMAIVSAAEMPDIAAHWQELVVAVLLNASILVVFAFVYLGYLTFKLSKRET